MDELLASREQMNRVSTEFLKVDLKTALTFVKIARQTPTTIKRSATAVPLEEPMKPWPGSPTRWTGTPRMGGR